jgi:hypothetical protein
MYDRFPMKVAYNLIDVRDDEVVDPIAQFCYS